MDNYVVARAFNLKNNESRVGTESAKNILTCPPHHLKTPGSSLYLILKRVFTDNFSLDIE